MVNRRQYVKRVGGGACVVLTGLAGCGSPSNDSGTESVAEGDTATETATEGEETDTEQEGGGGGGDSTVSMVTEGEAYYFDPVGLAVEAGASVTWENVAGSHSSTAYVEDNPQAEVRRIPDDAEGWNSETLSEEGATFSHTFDVEGTYDYYCIPHKSLEMVGRVVVGEPSGLGDDPPDGPLPDEQTIVDEGSVPYGQFESG